MKYIPSPEYYKEFFRRVPGKSSLVYRSISNNNIPSKISSHKGNKNTSQVIKPNLLDLDLSLLEETLNPDYDINKIKYLLKMNANPNISLSSGDKLTKKAIIYGQTDIITTFLQYGLDLNTPITARASQQNAVQLAKQWARTEISELFAHHIAATKNKSDIITSQNNADYSDLNLHGVISTEESSLDSDEL